MKKNLSALFLATGIGLLIVGVGLGFLLGFDSPVPWILLVALILIPLIYNRVVDRDQLQWKDSYSVGIQVLDDDHKKLIDLLNKFQLAYDYHTGEEFERQALDALVEYTRYHFEREEKIMEENGYPDLEAHRAQHRAMIAEVEKFIEEYKNQGHNALDGVANYLKGWLIHHINGTDKQYAPFLREKGLT
ncbi:MAG TPA: bacteriohemerythrin [Sedimenticola sp.]|nr:bacteriohemerythrin [Sedimenticola sp.]